MLAAEVEFILERTSRPVTERSPRAITGGDCFDSTVHLTGDAPRYLPPRAHGQSRMIVIEVGRSAADAKCAANLLSNGVFTR